MFSDKSHSNHCHILRNHKRPLPGPEGPLQECSRLPLPVFRRRGQVCNPSAWLPGSGSPLPSHSPAPTFQPSPPALGAWREGLWGLRGAGLQLSATGYRKGSPGTGVEVKTSPPMIDSELGNHPGLGDRCPLCSPRGHREGHATSTSQGIMGLRS